MGDIVLEYWPLSKIDLKKIAPVEHGKEVGIGHGELLTHEVRLTLEPLGQIVEPPAKSLSQ